MTKEKNRFSEGQTYTFTDWFTGGESFLTVDHIVEEDGIRKKVVFDAIYHEIDGDHKHIDTYDICENEDGEYVRVYEYEGSEARI